MYLPLCNLIVNLLDQNTNGKALVSKTQVIVGQETHTDSHLSLLHGIYP